MNCFEEGLSRLNNEQKSTQQLEGCKPQIKYMSCVQQILVELIEKSKEREDSDDEEEERKILMEYGEVKYEYLKIKLQWFLFQKVFKVA